MTEPAPPERRPRAGTAPAGTGIYTAQPAGPDATIGRFISWLRTRAPNAVQMREAIEATKQELAARFRRGDSVDLLVAAHAGVIDAALTHLWITNNVSDDHFCLVAVGGYGRAQLHPSSDIDILIIADDGRPETDAVEQFVAHLWDTGLEIGHSVRTVADCEALSREDVTVATTLMESRRLVGDPKLYSRMVEFTGPSRVWDAPSFFIAKREEQSSRHLRYDDTGYNLEPNVKGSPGGLRDIQMVSWIARRHVSATDFDDLASAGFMTRGQAERLIEARQFLWTIRYGLHVLTGRREDRLLFDHQKALAELLGYEDSRFTLGVEQMMQRYYRMVMQVSRTNEMLLQLFEEDILMPHDSAPGVIDESFVSRNGYLQAIDDDVFLRDPSAILTVFRLLQRNPDLKGVSARTIGLLRRNRQLVDEQFRQHPRNHRLFLDILRAPHGVTTELRRMNRYGILGRYIPSFGRIVGRMQYDLFHAYTVDEHTLFVVSNLRKFALKTGSCDHCATVMSQLPDPSLAYLSGLFHDIAKGRGGDHSELGATDALLFCREHGLKDDDSELVSWLVANHLVLSMTAQKKDLSDPDVIAAFANRMGSRRRLDYLYVLTVADVQATNPKLWNSWKAKLFRDLYEATAQALDRGLENPVNRQQLIDSAISAARERLRDVVDDNTIESVWSVMEEDYFLRHSAEEIAWHTSALATDGIDDPMMALAPRRSDNTLAIMLYTPQIQHTFAAVTARLDELGLSVLDARIEQLNNGFSLDTYIVANPTGQPLEESVVNDIEARLEMIPHAVDDPIESVQRRMPRRQRMFDTRTKVAFRDDPTTERTIMELVCADYPGLLYTVGITLIDCGVYIMAAKIVTIGERAEDVFYLTNEQENALDAEHQEALRHALLSALPGNVENL
ncbi:MAG: [protein-PII] uridylyltransferase [Pseudomonadota bacterium]